MYLSNNNKQKLDEILNLQSIVTKNKKLKPINDDLHQRLNWALEEKSKVELKINELYKEINFNKDQSLQFESTKIKIKSLEDKMIMLIQENDRLGSELIKTKQLLADEKSKIQNYERIDQTDFISSGLTYTQEPQSSNAEPTKRSLLKNESNEEVRVSSLEKERLQEIINGLTTELQTLRIKYFSLEKEVLTIRSADFNEEMKSYHLQDSRRMNYPNLPMIRDPSFSNNIQWDQFHQEVKIEGKEVVSVSLRKSDYSPHVIEKESDEEVDDHLELDLDGLGEEDRIGLLVEEIEKLGNKLTKKRDIEYFLRQKLKMLENVQKENIELHQQLSHLEKRVENESNNKRTDSSRNDVLANEPGFRLKIHSLNSEVEQLKKTIRDRNQVVDGL